MLVLARSQVAVTPQEPGTLLSHSQVTWRWVALAACVVACVVGGLGLGYTSGCGGESVVVVVSAAVFGLHAPSLRAPSVCVSECKRGGCV